MDRLIITIRTSLAILCVLGTGVFPAAAEAQFSQLSPRFARCDGLPLYPNASGLVGKAGDYWYVYQQAHPGVGDEDVRVWFAQHLPDWTFVTSPPNTWPVWWRFQDPRVPRSILVRLGGSPVLIEYACAF